MTARRKTWQFRYLSVVVALLCLASAAWAAEGRSRRAKLGDYNPADATVEMFAAMEKGDINVRLIPKDSTLCNVLIENKTDKPLNVKLPKAFAGVPALAQLGGGGGGGNRRSGNNSGGQNQSMGGGMGGMGGGGMGGGMFNVPPEKVGQFKVPTVCLEHGKREPHEQIPYEIKPIDSLKCKEGVREVCELLGSGKVDQRAAQVAAWHLNNDMTWEQLAAKEIRRAGGARFPYFSQEEIQNGMKIAFTATKLAAENPQKKDGDGTHYSPGTDPTAGSK